MQNRIQGWPNMKWSPPQVKNYRGSGKSPVEWFFSSYLRHFRGEQIGKPFDLLPWQADVLNRFLYTVGEDGLRQYDTLYLSVPRKNGKTTLAAALALYLMTMESEQGGAIYCAATSSDQAGEVFRDARGFTQTSPELQSAGVKTLQYSLSYVSRQGAECTLRALPYKSNAGHAIKPSAVIVDEAHLWTMSTGKEFFETLQTAMSHRREPLTIVITTRGADRHASLAYHLEQTLPTNPRALVEIHAAAEDDDIHSPKTWARANPSLGATVPLRSMEEASKAAMADASKLPTFRTLRLNQWVDSLTVGYIPMADYDACTELPPPEPDELADRPCYGGLDLSLTDDLTALVLLYPPRPGITEPWWTESHF